MRAPTEEFRRLDLRVHALLADVPLRDVHVVELHGGGAGRTLADVKAAVPDEKLMRANPLVRALFAIRFAAQSIFYPYMDIPSSNRSKFRWICLNL